MSRCNPRKRHFLTDPQIFGQRFEFCARGIGSPAGNPQPRIATLLLHLRESPQQVGIILRRRNAPGAQPDKGGFRARCGSPHSISGCRAALRVRREHLGVDAESAHGALMLRNRFQAHKSIRRGLAYGYRAQAPSICQSIRQHAHPATFIHVVHTRYDHGARHAGRTDCEQPRQNIGVKTVTVDHVRPELAQKTPPAPESRRNTRRILAHVEVGDRERRRPLLSQMRHQRKHRYVVTAPGHALCHGQSQLLRSAHTERCENGNDAHRAQTLPKGLSATIIALSQGFVFSVSWRGQATPFERFRRPSSLPADSPSPTALPAGQPRGKPPLPE